MAESTEKTLRDEFAIAAMSTWLGDSLAGGPFLDDYNPQELNWIARNAYNLANAMMEARKTKS